MKNKILAFLSILSLVLSFSVQTALATSLPPDPEIGKNINVNGTVYFIDSTGIPRAYTSAGAFLSYGFNSWADVINSSYPRFNFSYGDFIPPADGSLINDKGTVYLITNGHRAGFASSKVFTGLGYAWGNVIPGDTSFLITLSPLESASIAHPAGTIILQDRTAYLVASFGKVAIPALEIFDSWGYSWNKVVTANSYDISLPLLGSLNSRSSTQLTYNGGGLFYGEITLQGQFGGSWYPPGIVDAGTTIFMNTQNYGQLKLNWPGFIQCQSQLSYQPAQLGENFEVHGNYTEHGIDVCSSSSYYAKKI